MTQGTKSVLLFVHQHSLTLTLLTELVTALVQVVNLKMIKIWNVSLIALILGLYLFLAQEINVFSNVLVLIIGGTQTLIFAQPHVRLILQVENISKIIQQVEIFV